jgi:esterase/lipase
MSELLQRKGANVELDAITLQPSAKGLADTVFADYKEQVIAYAGSDVEILIGASMGGILSLSCAHSIKPKAIVILCSVIPAGVPSGEYKEVDFPSVQEYSKGPLQATVNCLPDATEAMCREVHSRWRDESGNVMGELFRGVQVESLPNCPVLCVIPGDDEIICPQNQRALARYLKADVVEYAGLRHISVVFGKRAKELARVTTEWLAARDIW